MRRSSTRVLLKRLAGGSGRALSFRAVSEASEPGISRFRVRIFDAPRNDERFPRPIHAARTLSRNFSTASLR